jgi:Flp pilus assembly protein TadG
MNCKLHGAMHERNLSGAVVSAGASFRATVRAFCRSCSADDGQSLAELGLVLPLLLLVLSGIFSFGILFNQYQVLTNATNDAARAFALSAGGGSGSTTSSAPNADPCAYVVTVTEADAPNLNSSSLNYTINYTVNSTSTKTTYSGSGSSGPTCASLAMNPLDTVQVTITYPVTMSIFRWANRSLTLSASSTELVQ